MAAGHIAQTVCVLLALSLPFAFSCDVIDPPDCSQHPVGSFHPHEASCSYFYRCNEFGIATAHACPSGLRFLHRDGYLCAPEERVICNRCPRLTRLADECNTTPPPCWTTTTPPPCNATTTEQSITTDPIQDCPPIPLCRPSENGTAKPYPADCGKYIVCTGTGYRFTLEDCAEGEHFSPTERVCKSPESANCPICIPGITTQTPSVLECPPSPDCYSWDVGRRKPFPPDCSLYTFCSEAGSVLLPCPSGLYFSPTLVRCLAPEVAQCPSCVPASTPPPPTCPPSPTCEGAEIGSRLSYPPDCTKFLLCLGEESMLRSCRQGLHFSPSQLMCMLPSEADCPLCITEPTTPTVTPIPVCPEIEGCSSEDINLFKPYPPDCSKFLYCDAIRGEVLSDCPELQHFSPSLLACMAPAIANCPDCIVTTTPMPSVTTDPPICPPYSQCRIFEWGSLKPYPEDCTKYVYCGWMGQEEILKCPPKKHFSPTALKCLPEQTANCPLCIPQEDPTTVTPDPTSSSTSSSSSTTTPPPKCPTITPCPTKAPENYSKVSRRVKPRIEEMVAKMPYPPDCTKYIYCFDSDEYYIGSCPEGLQFSPELSHCVPPEIAHCLFCVE